MQNTLAADGAIRRSSSLSQSRAASRTNALLAQHRPPAVALTEGYHLAFWIAFGLVIAAIAVAATVLRPASAPQASAEATQPAATRPEPELELAGCADRKPDYPAGG